ncbi:MAG: hypothetical protein J0I01_17635 [Stenotrophomonas nitritireducens]|uniref:hypothetical protein n=1 Tax=Stenotrophomonas nitritireducens TaxID=83617 RepID=UPI001AC1F193|nr:hypothetical protein [Stenotrophomonas nitritireducens]MBN8794050.1 hypothetical protein [Stenotrophomonas nitritireducens]MBN8797552.1 hypothetical protein [Stenotrophomonas nitritireducens]
MDVRKAQRLNQPGSDILRRTDWCARKEALNIDRCRGSKHIVEVDTAKQKRLAVRPLYGNGPDPLKVHRRIPE